MDDKNNLELFAEYWQKKVDAGEVCQISRLEWVVLEIYENWRLKQKEKVDAA